MSLLSLLATGDIDMAIVNMILSSSSCSGTFVFDPSNRRMLDLQRLRSCSRALRTALNTDLQLAVLRSASVGLPQYLEGGCSLAVLFIALHEPVFRRICIDEDPLAILFSLVVYTRVHCGFNAQKDFLQIHRGLLNYCLQKMKGPHWRSHVGRMYRLATLPIVLEGFILRCAPLHLDDSTGLLAASAADKSHICTVLEACCSLMTNMHYLMQEAPSGTRLVADLLWVPANPMHLKRARTQYQNMLRTRWGVPRRSPRLR